MRLGDVYRNDPVVYRDQHKRELDLDNHGAGPFVITKITPEGVYAKSLEDGRCFGPWSHPKNWGVLDVFLTEAYKANG